MNPVGYGIDLRCRRLRCGTVLGPYRGLCLSQSHLRVSTVTGCPWRWGHSWSHAPCPVGVAWWTESDPPALLCRVAGRGRREGGRAGLHCVCNGCTVVRSVFCMCASGPDQETSLLCVFHIYISIQNVYSVFISAKQTLLT